MTVWIASLSFEHHRNALGIAQRRPRISWRFSGNVKGWLQSSYELGIRRSGQPEQIHCVESAESVLVPWPGESLAPGESAIVRVRAYGQDDSSTFSGTDWSADEAVETGLDSSDWKCELIESSAPVDIDLPKQPVLFRRTFTNPSLEIRKARVYVTAHGVYELRINGQIVGDHVLAPGWTNYRHRLAYQVFDVTNLLLEGENVIAAEVGEGWYAGRLGFVSQRNIYGTTIGLVCQLVVTYGDGSVLLVGSDEQWRASTGGILTSEIYDGEVFDARLTKHGWSDLGFDDGGWHTVRSSPLANMVSTLIEPNAPPVRRIEYLPALEVIKSPSGKAIVDFGQNLVGWLRVTIKGQPGHIITFQHAEVLENGECATRPLREAAAKDTIILSQDKLIWEPKFTFHGFRYVGIENWPTPNGIPNLSDLTAVVVHTDMERTGWFECSDPLVSRLHRNVVWGMKGNFLSVPTDCPQRNERLGWTGDLQAFAPTAAFLYNSTGMLGDWLRGLSMEQLEDGGSVPPLVSPNILGDHGKVANAMYGDCLISCPWVLYEASGDLTILKTQYESMARWLATGIIRDHRGLWDAEKATQLGDWLDPAAPPNEPGNGRTDQFLVADAFLIGMTDLMVKIATTLNLYDDAQRYRESAATLRKHFADEYISPNGRVVSDSQTSLALCLYFSLFATTSQEQVAASRLSNIIRSKSRFKIATGFAGTPILGHTLTKVGQTQLFYRMLVHKKNPSWLYSVTMGATTIWERWDSILPDGTLNPGEMTSFNHYALGAVASWMHATMGGLRAGSGGWRRIEVKPQPGGGITWVNVKYKSPYGDIEVKWNIEGNRFAMTLQVPPNTEAVVAVPGMEGEIVVGSGTHSFETDYEAPEWPPLPIYPPFHPHDDDQP